MAGVEGKRGKILLKEIEFPDETKYIVLKDENWTNLTHWRVDQLINSQEADVTELNEKNKEGKLGFPDAEKWQLVGAKVDGTEMLFYKKKKKRPEHDDKKKKPPEHDDKERNTKRVIHNRYTCRVY